MNIILFFFFLSQSAFPKCSVFAPYELLECNFALSNISYYYHFNTTTKAQKSKFRLQIFPCVQFNGTTQNTDATTIKMLLKLFAKLWQGDNLRSCLLATHNKLITFRMNINFKIKEMYQKTFINLSVLCSHRCEHSNWKMYASSS